MLKSIGRRVAAWIAAALMTVLLGVFFQTQNVLSRLSKIGGDISFADRISTYFYDLTHLGTLYGLFILIALLIAFLTAGLLHHFTKFGRPVIFAAAGGVAILVMLFAMREAFFNVHIIAGARDALGISLQVLSGAVGGFLFHHLTKKGGPKTAPLENVPETI